MRYSEPEFKSTFNGKRFVNAKLTAEQVLEIRELYHLRIFNQKQLAKKYGVDESNISAIIRRKTWRNI